MKPYLIAEVGSNWQTLVHCLRSIEAAAESGADAVKFQAFDHDALYGSGNRSCTRMFGILRTEWLPALKDKADYCRIDFMCTAFSPDLVEIVNPYVSTHKIASSDACYPQLLQAVAKTCKPIFLSTGAKTYNEIERSLDCLGSAAARTTLLYCVASYPARTVDLRVMKKLDMLEVAGIGFSDHTTDIIQTPMSAIKAGATVLEKHFTAYPELDTPDRPHSLDPGEFKLMVQHIRGEKEPMIGPTYEEDAMLKRHNRRLIATRDIEKGEKLVYGVNFGAYRSLVDDTKGMSPFDWEKAHGKAIREAVKRGDPICYEQTGQGA